jgi:hypothetical protein
MEKIRRGTYMFMRGNNKSLEKKTGGEKGRPHPRIF